MEMRTIVKLTVALAALGLLLGGTALMANDEIGEQTGEKCTLCHDKPGSKLLTDRGLYFETQRTLEGYDEIQGSFGRCTSCHVRKPGSGKLTKEGKKMAGVVDSMEELREWLAENHPEAAQGGE
jgi:hypothetical protein